jgi:hypothetical protein
MISQSLTSLVLLPFENVVDGASLFGNPQHFAGHKPDFSGLAIQKVKVFVGQHFQGVDDVFQPNLHLRLSRYTG